MCVKPLWQYFSNAKLVYHWNSGGLTHLYNEDKFVNLAQTIINN